MIMYLLVNILARLGLLKKDLDYHLVPASMVIYIFFWYQKWFPYEAQTLVPVYQQRPAYFVDVPGFRSPRCQLVSRGFRMVVCLAFGRTGRNL